MGIELTDSTSAGRGHAAGSAVGRAALLALRAPSILNTQPWRWRLHDDVGELWADRGRQLKTTDPDGRLLVLSCGTGLHHATTALTALGYLPDIDRFPDPRRPDLLAVVRAGGDHRPTPADIRACQAIRIRRTDRRPYVTPVRVPADHLAALRDAAEERGAHLHVLRDDQVAALTVAAAHAAEAELSDPGYRDELNVWTHRPVAAGDGVPVGTAVPPVPRRVPVRDFAPGHTGLPAGEGDDRYASYAILFTDADGPSAWLAAGEALSAVLLTATARGLAANPISDVVESPTARRILTGILSGIGHPMLALRLGVAEAGTPVPAAPRRPAEQVIDAGDSYRECG